MGTYKSLIGHNYIFYSSLGHRLCLFNGSGTLGTMTFSLEILYAIIATVKHKDHCHLRHLIAFETSFTKSGELFMLQANYDDYYKVAYLPVASTVYKIICIFMLHTSDNYIPTPASHF